jgi:hypothetical protein
MRRTFILLFALVLWSCKDKEQVESQAPGLSENEYLINMVDWRVEEGDDSRYYFLFLHADQELWQCAFDVEFRGSNANGEYIVQIVGLESSSDVCVEDALPEELQCRYIPIEFRAYQYLSGENGGFPVKVLNDVTNAGAAGHAELFNNCL